MLTLHLLLQAVVSYQGDAKPHVLVLRQDSVQVASDSSSPRGFTTSFATTAYYSSLSNYVSGNHDFSIGFGYNISPQILAGIRVYAGMQQTSTAYTQPIAGRFDLGGGAVQLTYRFLSSGPWRSFVRAGYELSTILTSETQAGSGGTGTTSGYNGRGFQLYTGVEYLTTPRIGIEGNIMYRRRQYTDLIIAGQNLGSRAAFNDNCYGVSLGCNLNFNFLP